jgi:hypothetical protein
MCSLMQARSLLFPGETPGHSLLRSATQCPTANLSCAVAFDDHTIKMAPIIRTIFAMEGLPPLVAKYLAAKNLLASRRFEIELNQMDDTTLKSAGLGKCKNSASGIYTSRARRILAPHPPFGARQQLPVRIGQLCIIR